MENLSRTSRRHTSKLINNGGGGGVLAKTLYDDVYGGPPKFSASISPRLEDYTEIFGSSRAAASSSTIPFLDLPAVDHDDFFDCRSSGFDFSEVFGGFEELDFAVAYDDVAKTNNCGDSSDEAWTSAGSGSGESNHSLKNTSFFYGDCNYSFDGSSEFGISYNKALKKSNKESSHRRTRVNVIPAASENRYVPDEISLTRQKKSDNKSLQAADDRKFNMYSAVEVANESLLRKTVNGSSGEQAYGDSRKTERESGKKSSRHKEPLLNISDINLRTQASHLPPPCRLPPLVDRNSEDSGRLSSNSNTVSSHERTCDISPPVYDVEVDSSSSASVSAAAMREAMEKARIQLRSAKELMQKRRSKSRSMKESREERKVGKFDGSSNKKGDRVERTSEREDSKITFAVSEEKQNVLKVREDSESSESAKNLVQEKHVKGSWSSQGSIEIDEACEWQEATQYFELVALDDTKKAFELTNEDEILVHTTNSDENVVDIEAYHPEYRHKESCQSEGLENRKETSELEEKERRLEEAFFIQAKTEKRLKEDFEQEENEKRLKEAQQQVETEKEVKKTRELQEKEVKKAQELQEKEINLQQALDQEKKKIQKEAALREENEKRLKELIDKEEIKMRLKEENEKRLKKARQMQENEKRIKEVLEQENKMRQKEVAERQENEKRLKEALEFEEYQRRQKDDREREENERRLKMEALEFEEYQKRQKDDHEREENERRLKMEAQEFEENQKRQKDDREREENERRLKMVHASEQQIALNRLNESQGKAYKQAEIHQKLDDASLLEQTRKNIKVADNKEVDVLNITQAATEINVDVQEPMSVKGTHLPVAVEDHKLSDGTCNQECSANNQASQIGRNHDENSETESSNNKICGTMSGVEVVESVNVSLNEHVPSDPSVNKATEEVVTEPRVTKGEKARVTMTNGPVDEQFKAPRLSSWAEESTESGSSGTEDAYESLPFVDFVKKAVEASCSSETTQPKCNSTSQKDSDHTSQNMEDNLAAEPEKEFVDSRKKTEAAYSSMADLNHWKSSQQVNGRQAPGRKVENLKEDKLNGEKVTERLKRERELESDRRMKIEEEREREREGEKDRMGVDRATLEARERAEKVASERATAGARQRAMAEARERLEKACAEARERSLAGKAAMEAKLKMDRAAVERATLEARERAAAKLMAERDRIQRSVSDKFSASSRTNELRHCSSSSDLQGPQISRQSYSRAYGVKCEGDEAESAQRCKARLERHARTAERAAKALADKNMRDLLAQREQAERNRLAETLDADVKRWSSGKEGNLRALLSTLQYILGSDSGWQPIHMTEVITAAAVKRAYRKATLCVHPDKLQQRGASIHQKYLCEKVFDLLKEAWNRFNSEER